MAVKTSYSGLKKPRVVYKDPVDMAADMVRGDLGTPASGQGGPWSQSAEDAADKYLNREKFQYDVNEDALYHQYKDLYTMQGQQAMVDTMGQAATLTGGYGNSYAQTAGQQAYQGHIQKLGEVVPELYQLALDRYRMEGDQMRDQASFLAQMDDRDYSRWESERDFQYQKDQDAEDKRRYDQEWEEDKWRYDAQWQKKYGQKPDRGDGTDTGGSNSGGGSRKPSGSNNPYLQQFFERNKPPYNGTEAAKESWRQSVKWQAQRDYEQGKLSDLDMQIILDMVYRV